MKPLTIVQLWDRIGTCVAWFMIVTTLFGIIYALVTIK